MYHYTVWEVGEGISLDLITSRLLQLSTGLPFKRTDFKDIRLCGATIVSLLQWKEDSSQF